jgi:[ribosomal protein S5]-alanine N-acetyltransferase
VTPTPGLPPWPAEPVAYGPVVLRQFSDLDVPMVMEMSTDPYVPLIGSLPADTSPQEAQAWIERQRGRLAEGAGFSFAIAEADTDRAVGGVGLWLRALAQGRAEVGYSVIPSARGRGIAAVALIAVTRFAWTIPALYRIELHIEPWNTGSIRTAEKAGYEREGLLRSHQEIGGQRRDMLLYATIRPRSAAAGGAGRPGLGAGRANATRRRTSGLAARGRIGMCSSGPGWATMQRAPAGVAQ